MNEMAEMNTLLKKAVKCTYKKLTSVPKQYPKKTINNVKTLKKMVKFIENPTKEDKSMNKTSKRKNDSDYSKKIATSILNTVSQV